MRRLLPLLLLLATMTHSPIAAQAPDRCSQRDAPLIGCGWPHDTTAAQRRETGTAVFIGATTLTVYSNLAWHWDRDAGGYPDRFYSEKALAHAGAAAALVQAALALHVRPMTAILWTNVAGAGFEISQGHVNPHDLAANALGSVGGYLLASWLTRVRW